jgi:AraC-like DNA-binding protein
MLFFVIMLQDLKIREIYDGFIFLAEAKRHLPYLKTHRHVELELNLVVRGTITYVVYGRRFTFPHGTLLWMFPSQEHQLVDRSKDGAYYVAVFKPSLIKSACMGKGYQGLKRKSPMRRGVMHKMLEPAAFDVMRQTMDAMMEGSLDADVLNQEGGFGFASNFLYDHGDPDALNAGLHYLIIQAWKHSRTGHHVGGSVDLHPSVQKALELLGRLDASEGSFAARCGMSETYLSRLFHRQVGVPLNRYRNSVRLARFLDMAKSSRAKTILECVYEAGFGSYAQFYKIFTQNYHQGPREFLGRSCAKSETD